MERPVIAFLSPRWLWGKLKMGDNKVMTAMGPLRLVSHRTILSNRADGCGFFYGHFTDRRGYARHVNVRHEGLAYRAYVDGEMIIGSWSCIGDAEDAAIEWAEANRHAS